VKRYDDDSETQPKGSSLSPLAKSVCCRELQFRKFRRPAAVAFGFSHLSAGIMKGAKVAGLLAFAILALNQASAVTKDFGHQGEVTKPGTLLGAIVPPLRPKQALAQIVQSNWWPINDPIGVTRAGTVLGMTILVVLHRVKGRRGLTATWSGNQTLPPPSIQEASDYPSRGFKCADLRRIKLFEDFEESQLEAFSHYLEAVDCPQFGHLIREGKRGEAMYLVLEGEVRALRIVEGREFLLGIIPAGQWFGEISVLDRGPREVDVIANKDSILLQLSSDAFDHMHREAPLLANQFLLVLARTLADRMRCMHKRFEDSLRFIQTSGIANANYEPESRSKPLSPAQHRDGSWPCPLERARSRPSATGRNC